MYIYMIVIPININVILIKQNLFSKTEEIIFRIFKN